jgi:hypothetical protein
MQVVSAVSLDEMLSLIGGGWERSALFKFLREHHDRIVERQDGERMDWQSLCAWFAASGLTNKRGDAPTSSCARKTWYRVRQMVARARARAAAVVAAREQAQLVEEARREASKEAARAEQAQKVADRDRLRKRYEEGQRAAGWARDLEHDRQAMVARASTTPGEQPIVRIGQVATVKRMLEAAPRYGDDALKPLPPPYVGPRPQGMPDDLPLEALVSLDASGLKANDDTDFENMPGLPRRSFFKEEFQWAKACMSMIRPIPPRERSLALSAMFNWLRMFPGIK